ncbi:MAG: cache domain-containing protein [Polyangiaceae bacterium]
MSFRRSGPSLLIWVTTLSTLALMGVAILLTLELHEKANEGDFELIQKVFETRRAALEDEAVEAAELVVSIPTIRKAFLEHDRPKLLAECSRMFAVQKEKYGLDRAEFHEASGINFLRLHQPDKFGDDDMQLRPMLVEAHRNKAIRLGIEVGTYGPAVSAIVPILDDGGNFAGSFEIALDFEPVLDELKKSFEFEGAVFLDEQLLREVATALTGDDVSTRKRVGPYIRLHSTHEDLMENLVTAKEVDASEPRSYERQADGTEWGVQLMPLYDHAHKRIGAVAMAHDFGDDESIARRAFVWLALATLFACVVMAGAILVVIRGKLLAPLAALNGRMSALVSGEEAPAADPIDSYCDELKTLASNYEVLRTRRDE